MRIEAEPAYVLHTYPYSETSLIVEAFSRHYGRLVLVAKGARRPKSALRGLLLSFSPLHISFSGKGEVKTLTGVEWQGGLAQLTGKALLCGYYFNELIMHLLRREDAHEQLFAAYEKALFALAQTPFNPATLRAFEWELLNEIGYGASLTKDAEGSPLLPTERYFYDIEKGAILCTLEDTNNESFLGQTLIDLQKQDFSQKAALKEMKKFLRNLISHHTGGKILETRKLLLSMNSF